MSRAIFRKPEFRLHFGYSTITLTRGDAPEPVRAATLGDPSFPDDFRGIGDDVARAAGRVTVVLPESEVWRGALDLAARTPFGRWREARLAVAARLSLLPRALVVALGPKDAAGRTPVAAVTREALHETRSFLSLAGLRPAAIVGAGAFPGFEAPPRFATTLWRVPVLPILSRSDRRAATAAMAGVLTLASVVGLGLGPAPRAPEPPPLAALQPGAPAAAPAAPATALALVAPPRPRPDPAPRAARQPAVRAAAPRPAATVASRNLPLLGLHAQREPAPGMRLAALNTARARLADALAATPLRRQGPAPAAAAAAPAAPRPMHRPAPAQAAAPEPAPAAVAKPAAAAEAAPRPRARPGDATKALAAAVAKAVPAPVAVAALVPPPRPGNPARALADAVAEAAPVTVAALAPPPRPARAAAPALAKAAAQQPVRKAAAPKPVAVQRVQPPAPTRAPQAVRQPAPAKQVVRAAAPPKQTVRVAAAPKQAVRQAAAPATQSRSARPPRNLALIGVFGASGDRHALVQLPTGAVQRVRPGDRLQGVQVAAVGADSVRLRGGGRETVLTLPE